MKKTFALLFIFVLLFSSISYAKDINPYGVYGVGSLEKIKKAINNGAEINKPGKKGTTPIMQAALFNDDPEVIEYLLKKGADPTIENNGGYNALDSIKDNDELVNTYVYDLIKDKVNGKNKSDDSKKKTNKLNNSKYNFRKTKWGMSKKQVKENESEQLYDQTKDGFVYETKLANLDAYITYIFSNNKLTTAGYLFKEKHTNKNNYINDLAKINTLLEKKYGKPTNENVEWENNLYSDNKSKYGFAISLGHLVFEYQWETDKTKIISKLSGENYKINHALIYNAKGELNEEARKNKEKETLDNL